MSLIRKFILITAVSFALAVPGTGLASEEHRAENLCKQKITEVYGVTDMRQVWNEKIGNHKYLVHGKVKTNNHKYPFNCKVKNGNIKSYSYNGPHERHPEKEDDDDSNMGTVVAVGAGLALLAVLAASSSDDDKEAESDISVKQSVLEDDCHDILQYRIRDEQNSSARVKLKEVSLSGRDLKGDAKVKYDNRHPQHATFTCHFNKEGRLLDSKYHIY